MGRKAIRKREELEVNKKEMVREALEEKLEPEIEKEIMIEEISEEVPVIEEIKEIKVAPEEERKKKIQEKLATWKPKTELGRLVKDGVITNIDEILDKNKKIFEPEIVEALLPNLDYDLINIGQAKGKFGGGKRRPWRQTQKKTGEGNIPKFSALVVVGDRNGHIGVGLSKSKETVNAREKAIRRALLNIFKVTRGCGSFDCICNDPHSIPLVVDGKSSSAKVILKPAPRGTGTVADEEIKKIFRLAGIKDIYVKSFGKTRTKFNHVMAVVNALKKLNKLT